MGIQSIVFIVCLAAAVYFFAKNVSKIVRNIRLGKPLDRSDNSAERWKTMAKVALGQSKMVVRPVAGFMHILIYVGFVIINLEMLEIVLDGIFGTHRIFTAVLGDFYIPFINIFEVLALGVLISCVVFLVRRNVLKLKRFHLKEMNGFPKSDANYILIIEILLMTAFLMMNAADSLLMKLASFPAAADNESLQHYNIIAEAYSKEFFLVSQWITGMFPDSLQFFVVVERFCWWFHILGILAFLNYLPFSKHWHIIMAFPNTYFSNLKNKGEFNNLETVKKEVAMMFDPNIDPYAAPPADAEPAAPQTFGAKDVTDLTWKQLMDAYTCTECGRCSSECPANQTGKLLSPRKIMMDTRDRITEVGNNIDKHGADYTDGKTLINDYITAEELWACTSCNACTEACPVNIDPLSIIIDLRRYLVMEQSAAPAELNNVFTNIENNGAPWQFSQADRFNWSNEL